MSASDSKVVVDHESDLASSWKRVLFLGLLFLEKWEFLASSLSKFEKFFPAIDREDFHSSTESTISASLIHNKASKGKSEQAVTWFLNLIFQYETVEGVVNLSKLEFRYLLSLQSNHRILWHIHWQKGTHFRRPSCECQHWNCAPHSFFISCDRCPCTSMHWNRTCSTWSCRVKNSLIRCL